VLKAGDTMTGALVHPLGAAATPSLTFTGDLDTGVFSPGANQVAVATNGTGRLFVDASGNIGAGYSTPGNFAGGDLGATRPLVVGDGTASTNVYIFSDSTVYGHLAFSDGTSGTSTYAGLIQYYHTTDSMALYTAATERLRITSGGRVGIGTSSPGTTVEIQGSNNTLINSRGNLFVADGGTAAQAAGEGGQISFGAWLNGDLSSPSPVATIKGVTESSTLNINLGALLFGTSETGATITERMRITSGGNVGIGTTSPASILHCASTGDNNIRVVANGATAQLGVDGGAPFVGTNSGPFNFYSNGNISATLDSSGRLLVGTSTAVGTDGLQLKGPAGGNAAFKMLGGNTASLSINAAIAQINFTEGYWGGTGAQITAVADAAQGNDDYPTRLEFSTTADGASSPTERMRITSAGQVRLAGAGITFNGDTAAANELDDYEEGTFTPTVLGSTTAGTGTYTSRGGIYTKIGNVVTFCLDFILSAHTGTGDMLVAGLPFPSNAINYQANIVARQNLSLTASHYFGGSYMSPSTSFVELSQMPVGGGTPAAIPMDSVCDVRLQGFYYV
jgi:hypothetical protein